MKNPAYIHVSKHYCIKLEIISHAEGAVFHLEHAGAHNCQNNVIIKNIPKSLETGGRFVPVAVAFNAHSVATSWKNNFAVYLHAYATFLLYIIINLRYHSFLILISFSVPL